MSTTPALLEDQLRAVLARAAELAPVLPGLAPLPARPPAYQRRSVRLTAAAAVVTAAVVVGVTTFGSSSGRAFADWTSTPRAADPAVTAALAKACGIADPLVVDLRGTAGYVVGAPSASSPGAAPGGDIDCLVGVPGEPRDPGLRDTEISGQPPALVTTPTAADPLVVLSAKSPEGNDVHQHDVTWVSGRVDAAVASVKVATTTGMVTATVSGGRFAAWWPGNDGDVAVVRAYSADGTLLSTSDNLGCDDQDGHLDPRVTLPGRPPTGGCTAG